MKNIGQYNQDLSVPRKKDIDSLETRVKTNEDNIAMAESDIEGLNTDVSTLKTDVSNVKTALNSKQDTIVGAASTIVENNLTAGKVLVSDASGKVSAANNIGYNDAALLITDAKLVSQVGAYAEIILDGKNLIGTAANASTEAMEEGIVIGSISDGRYALLKADSITFGDDEPIKVAGVADATNTNDAVNLKQLNEVKKSIPSSSDFVKTSGGMVTGPLYLLGGTGALNVKNGSVTLNEGYSIGYGDGNYNFTQISGNFLISKGNSGQGVYIASSTDGTNGSLTINVNNDSQNATTHMNIASNGVISLSANDSSGGSYMVNNVRITGVANGTANNDAVNLGQLNAVKNSIPDTSNFAPATAGLKVLSDTGGTFQYLGSVTTKLYYYSFTSRYSLPSNAVLLDIAIPYSSTIGIFKVMCSYIQSWSPAKIWFMSMNYVTDFTHDGSTKIYYMLA